VARTKRWTTKANGDGSGQIEVTLTSWKYFSDYVNQELLNYSTYIYRGHGDRNWLLQPTIDRHISDPDSYERIEHLEQFKFATRGRRGSNPPELIEDNDWWALGQHHGLMTPLLDWSESPFVSLYFAITECLKIKAKHLSVFCLSQYSTKIINTKIETGESIELINGQKPTVKIVRPQSDENSRLVSQRGLFTRGPNNLDLEKWIAKFHPESEYMDLIKINIPNQGLENCLKYLNRMNVNSATLFPDLSGASQFCNYSLDIKEY
jgi:hypothetical protein